MDKPGECAPPALRRLPGLLQHLGNRGMLALIEALSTGRTLSLYARGFRAHRIVTRKGPVHILDAKGGSKGVTWAFVHGFASRASDWHSLMLLMLPHCARILAIDLPGHGRSPVTAAGLNAETLTEAGIEAIRQILGPQEQCVPVGNSMGGLGAIRLAQHLPERVPALALISPAGAPLDAGQMEALLASFAIQDLKAALGFVDRLYPDAGRARHLQARAILAYFNQPGLQSLLQHYRTYPFLRQDELGALPKCLLVWGQADAFFPPENRIFYEKGLRSAHTTVVTPERFGHTPFLDQPQAVAQVLLNWARALRPPLIF